MGHRDGISSQPRETRALITLTPSSSQDAPLARPAAVLAFCRAICASGLQSTYRDTCGTPPAPSKHKGHQLKHTQCARHLRWSSWRACGRVQWPSCGSGCWWACKSVLAHGRCISKRAMGRPSRRPLRTSAAQVCSKGARRSPLASCQLAALGRYLCTCVRPSAGDDTTIFLQPGSVLSLANATIIDAVPVRLCRIEASDSWQRQPVAVPRAESWTCILCLARCRVQADPSYRPFSAGILTITSSPTNDSRTAPTILDAGMRSGFSSAGKTLQQRTPARHRRLSLLRAPRPCALGTECICCGILGMACTAYVTRVDARCALLRAGGQPVLCVDACCALRLVMLSADTDCVLLRAGGQPVLFTGTAELHLVNLVLVNLCESTFRLTAGGSLTWYTGSKRLLHRPWHSQPCTPQHCSAADYSVVCSSYTP